MSGFVVQGPKSDYRDSSGLKNGLYPFVHQLKVETDEQKPKPNLEPVPDPTHPKAHLRSKSKPADG